MVGALLANRPNFLTQDVTAEEQSAPSDGF